MVLAVFSPRAILRRGTNGPCASVRYLRNTDGPTMRIPVSSVGGPGHQGQRLKPGGRESALRGDRDVPRPARYPGSDGGRKQQQKRKNKKKQQPGDGSGSAKR